MSEMILTTRCYDSIDWESKFNDFISKEGLSVKSHCPFEGCHKNNNTDRDFTISLSKHEKEDGFKCIYVGCFHESCSSEIHQYKKELNRKWAAYISTGVVTCIELSPKDKLEIQKRREEKLRQEVESKLRLRSEIKAIQSKLKTFDIPSPVFKEPRKDIYACIELFDREDIIFIGSTYDSKGHLYYANASEIFDKGIRSQHPNFTTAFAYKDIDGARCKDNVKEQKFIILEMDNTDKQTQWNYLMYFNNNVKSLVMAVDTGNKSIHGWFRYDDKFLDAELFVKLGYDRKMFSNTQPCRLPGFYRVEKKTFQRIIYYNKAA